MVAGVFSASLTAVKLDFALFVHYDPCMEKKSLSWPWSW
jgi:hypothetical protein